jgi:hypothetical protein
MLSEDKAFELINRRRRQMHVHSVLYYHMNTSIIDDHTFDKWAVELASLQRDFPQFKHKGYMPGIFENWTGDTGMHLPITDAVYSLAEHLLADAQKRNATTTPASKAKPGEDRWEGLGYESK